MRFNKATAANPANSVGWHNPDAVGQCGLSVSPP